MSDKRIISVGNRREFPRSEWGPRDHLAEQLESAAISSPLPHAPGGPPPELKFSLFPERVEDGARSKAIDELISMYTGRR